MSLSLLMKGFELNTFFEIALIARVILANSQNCQFENLLLVEVKIVATRK